MPSDLTPCPLSEGEGAKLPSPVGEGLGVGLLGMTGLFSSSSSTRGA